MAPVQTEVPLRNRDLYTAQVGLAILAGGREGNVELYATFKYHLSVARAAVDRSIEDIARGRIELRDENGKRDAKQNLMTAQIDPKRPNATEIVLVDPFKFEKLERDYLDQETVVKFNAPKLKLADVLALDFAGQTGDYSGALPFIDADEAPEKPAPGRAAAKKAAKP